MGKALTHDSCVGNVSYFNSDTPIWPRPQPGTNCRWEGPDTSSGRAEMHARALADLEYDAASNVYMNKAPDICMNTAFNICMNAAFIIYLNAASNICMNTA